jgi:hypothetical protein
MAAAAGEDHWSASTAGTSMQLHGSGNDTDTSSQGGKVQILLEPSVARAIASIITATAIAQFRHKTKEHLGKKGLADPSLQVSVL